MTWDGAGAGDVDFLFVEGIDETSSLSCSIPAAAGRASLPAAALAKLGATPTLYMAAQSRANVQLGAVRLTVADTFAGVFSDGSYAAVHVQFGP